jgi:hypothetical protein
MTIHTLIQRFSHAWMKQAFIQYGQHETPSGIQIAPAGHPQAY